MTWPSCCAVRTVRLFILTTIILSLLQTLFLLFILTSCRLYISLSNYTFLAYHSRTVKAGKLVLPFVCVLQHQEPWRMYNETIGILLFNFVFIPLKMKRKLSETQFVPRSKHFVWIIKTNQFMLYRADIAVCSEINLCVGRMHSAWMLNLVVHQVIRRL
jgi:hypothetical protein